MGGGASQQLALLLLVRALPLATVPVAGSVLAPRLRVHPDGSVRDPAGAAWRGKGVNWGARLTPSPESGGGLYNASDPFIAGRLLPSVNHVRLVLDYYSGGVCPTDIFSEAAVDTGHITKNLFDPLFDEPYARVTAPLMRYVDVLALRALLGESVAVSSQIVQG